MNNRSIRRVFPSQKVNMGGILLEQPLPQKGVESIDPFLLVHHWSQVYKGGEQQSEVGVGPHPHRGFSPVTFIFKGGVHHRDSTGYSGVIDAGGTQWMNAGKGIVHSERPRKEIAEKGGEFEIIQFWVNAPAAKKMDEPSYQPLSSEETPCYYSDDKKVEMAVVAGEMKGVKGKIRTDSDLLTLRFTMQSGGKIELPLPKNHNAFIYQLDGNLVINGDTNISGKQLIWFNNDGKSIELASESGSRFILLSGAPINEPVAAYGPFVMNTQNEIIKALNDYQSGVMGALNEVFN
jgi:redox-sensitive bicupin YhaK (pirin superfamily)